VLAHYLAVALAKLAKAPFTTAANVLTLALGLACFIAAWGIATWWGGADTYHQKADRTVFIGQGVTRVGEGAIPIGPASSPTLARYLKTDIPEVELAARIAPQSDTAVAAGGAKTFLDAAIADPELLQIFDFDFIAGDARTALDEPGSVVLTRDAAARLFGAEPALGQRLVIDGGEEGVVTGVIEPVREPSFMGTGPDAAIPVDMLRHWASSARGARLDQGEDWFSLNNVTFAVLPPGMTRRAFDARLAAMFDARVPDEAGAVFEAELKSFQASQLRTLGLNEQLLSQSGVGVSALTVLIGLGVLTLVVAGVNFANLSTAHALWRVKEIGMRKTLGAGRLQVMAQSWLEALLQTGAALALAVGVIALAAPAVRASTGVDMLFLLREGPGPYAVLGGVLLLVAFLAGGYPALVLSRVRPVEALRSGKSRTGSRLFARVLIGVQFFSASFLLIVIVVAQLQRAHLEEAALAPGGDPLVVLNDVRGPGIDFDTLEARLEQIPGVESISLTDTQPWSPGYALMRLSRSPEQGARVVSGYIKRIGDGYFATLDIDLLAGRDFDRARDAQTTPAGASQPLSLIIDRAYANVMGFESPAAAIGEMLYVPSVDIGATGPSTAPGVIVGVSETETTRLEATGVAGTIYVASPPEGATAQRPLVRIDREAIPATLAAMTRVWDELAPDIPLNAQFAEALFEQRFQSYARATQVFMLLGGAAFIIASVGQLGIAVHVVVRRRHEMGVRKTLGATALGIARLLLVDFSKPALAANLAAWPVGYLAAQTYLAGFADRIALTPTPFALSMLITLAVAWAAVMGEVLKAASVRPAEVLRNA
jgi:putative ABC transport system permease protein